MEKEKIKIVPIIIGVLIQVAVTLLSISLFSVIINLAEIDYKYSPVFGSVAVALGAFVGSFYHSGKKGTKGYLTGMLVGIITFIIVTLVGLIINDGGITINTLFHLIIIMLSAVSGGIMGVNKKGNRYI